MSDMAERNEQTPLETPEEGKNNKPHFFKKKLGKLPMWAVIAAVLAVSAGVIFAVIPKDKKAEEPVEQIEAKAVKVTEFSKRGSEAFLYYIGTVQPEKTQQATYAGISEVTAVYVEGADDVRVGTALAAVDPGNSETAARNAQTALNEAKSAQTEAQINYDNAKAQNDRYKEMTAVETALDTAKKELATATEEKDAAYDALLANPQDTDLQAAFAEKEAVFDEKAAAVTTKQAEYDAIKAELDDYREVAKQNGYPTTQAGTYYESQERIAKATLDESNTTLKNAQTNYDEYSGELNKCTIYSELNGYVVGVYAEVGEVATPLNPIVVVGTYDSVAAVGISAGDIRDIALGQLCEITVNGTVHEGKVVEIGTVPDTNSRTYEVKVSLPRSESRYLIGDIASVKINIGEKLGVWLPISVVLNDGEDYVYIVENGRAMKKYIKITEIANDYVCVTGLEDGGIVVTEGMKTLKSGDAVNIVD